MPRREASKRIIVCVCVEGEGEEGGWGSCDPTAPRPVPQAGESQAHVGGCPAAPPPTRPRAGGYWVGREARGRARALASTTRTRSRSSSSTQTAPARAHAGEKGGALSGPGPTVDPWVAAYLPACAVGTYLRVPRGGQPRVKANGEAERRSKGRLASVTSAAAPHRPAR